MKKKRVVAWFLSVVMMVSALPQQVFAVESEMQVATLLDMEKETEDKSEVDQDPVSSLPSESVELNEKVEEGIGQEKEQKVLGGDATKDLETEVDIEEEGVMEKESNDDQPAATEAQETALEEEKERQSKAADMETEGFTYRIDNDQISITGWTGTEKNLVIPDFIEGKPVVEISTGAFVDSMTMENVTLPNQEIALKSEAFQRCSNLRQIKIQKKIVDIGKNAFVDCGALTTVVLGKDVSGLLRYDDGTTFGTALTEFHNFSESQ